MLASDALKVLSLGWGVQSFTLAAMAALGEIEQPDVAIHADTSFEASGTYDFAAQWTPWLAARGVKVVTVHPINPQINTERLGGEIYIPAYTAGTYTVNVDDGVYTDDEDELQLVGTREVESRGQLRSSWRTNQVWADRSPIRQ